MLWSRLKYQVSSFLHFGCLSHFACFGSMAAFLWTYHSEAVGQMIVRRLILCVRTPLKTRFLVNLDSPMKSMSPVHDGQGDGVQNF